jgi:hypothetical protein
MTDYVINNLKILTDTDAALNTIPDVFFYVVPLVVFTPEAFGIKNELGEYVDNPHIRMMVLELFETLIEPCFEFKDDAEEINKFVGYFFEDSGYYIDEPIVNVVKRIMTGEDVKKEETIHSEFNGIDIISAHDNAFKLIRPPLPESSSASEPVAGKKRGRPDVFVPSTPLRAPGDRGGPPHPLASMLTPAMPSTFSIEERSPPSTIRRPDEEEISGGGSASSATRRRQRRRQQKKLLTRKAQKIGGLRATFEIVPH